MAALGFTVENRRTGKMLMANENDFRIFKTKQKAMKFLKNLIWVSKDLTIHDFKFYRAHG